MKNSVLDEKPLQVFVILAKTLEAWRNPTTHEGIIVLMKHYAWAAELKARGAIILAGPTDFDLTSTGIINSIGHTTGLIVLNVSSREKAEALAFQDPFHVNEFRKNDVFSFKITMTENSLKESLEKIISKN